MLEARWGSTGTPLDWIEMASGAIVDWQGGRPAPSGHHKVSSRQALAVAVRDALVTPPCLVAFSGGRDSSAVLAVAAETAKREGLPLPVPVSLRFEGAPKADETDWQELVVRHVGVQDWVRLPIDDELDFLGPYARRGLRSYGLVHPANAHFMAPMLERAAGGAVLTGAFGDQLFGAWRWQGAADSRAGRRRLTGRSAGVRGLARLPPSARCFVEVHRGRRQQLRFVDWLRPVPTRMLSDRIARARGLEAPSWSDWVRSFGHGREMQLYRQSAALLSHEYQARLVHPLADEGFLQALADEGGRDGFGDRTTIMAKLFGDVLPKSLIQRPTKAAFPLFGKQCAAFVARWHGDGLPDGLVDSEILRAKGLEYYGASYLWQYLWLQQDQGRAD